jgi:hypothetical protein
MVSAQKSGQQQLFQVMPCAQWLALLCKHVPDRDEPLVRTLGGYWNRARGERAKEASAQAGAALTSRQGSSTGFAARAKAA